MHHSFSWLRWMPFHIIVLYSIPAVSQFNNPPGTDIWCGKAYRPADPAFDPGGWFQEPPFSEIPLLNLRVRPRMSIYLEAESDGSILIDASISNQIGQPLPAGYKSVTNLEVEIVTEHGFSTTVIIDIDSTDNEIPLRLDQFPARVNGSDISIRTLVQGVAYGASTQVFRLPLPDSYGSVSRIDNLYGGLWVQRDNEAWRHIFPYTYYVQWSLYWNESVDTLNDFASLGYNVIHIVPTGTLGDKPFPWDQFDSYLQRADELGLYLQYDVIWDFQNITGMIEQVERIRGHRSLLLWYQSDEPDGKSNPVNSTGLAYSKIRELDPYHPSSLALNCYDFYYAEYGQGGDIIMSDVYPISTNTSFSTVYGTVCNATYGCCGCDDCEGSFEDISNRLDEFHRRDALLGWSKTQWFAPQAFGNETFWTRYPTAAEEVVMTWLAINHGAKGIVMWNYPTTNELLHVTNLLAHILTDGNTADFLLGVPLTQKLTVRGATRVDAAMWASETSGLALLSIINLNYGNVDSQVEVVAPDGVTFTSVADTLWGDLTWSVEKDCTLVTSGEMLGLQVSVMLVNLSSARP